jgi:outer membrane protein assembly factor BamA
LYLGRIGLVRGYPYSTARSACEISTEDTCGILDALMGSRLLVSQLEWLVPVRGALSGQFDWGSLPIEALFFADAGTAWDTGERPPWFRGSRALFASAGAGVRLNPAGFVLEFDLARRISAESAGWSFLFNVRPGF